MGLWTSKSVDRLNSNRRTGQMMCYKPRRGAPTPPGTPPWPRRGYRPRRRSGHPTGPQFGYHPAPKLSVGLHAVDAPDYLAGLDHVVIVPGQHGGGRGSWHAAGRQHLYDRGSIFMMIVSPVTRSRTVTSACRASLERQSGLEHLDCIEGEFGIEAALDVGALAKPVLLA